VVHYGEYRVLASAWWEVGDEVEADLLERESVWFGGYSVRCVLGSVRDVFILLTGRAAFDVVFYPSGHPWPPEVCLY
jgi:hypothetical protein